MAEKTDPKSSPRDLDVEAATSTETSSWWASVFGGEDVKVGPRIAELPAFAQTGKDLSDVPDPALAILNSQLQAEQDTQIQYRTCSWQKTAGLLFSEYICLAIMSFPWSYSVLGLVPGIILTVAIAASVLYTSLVLWKFCLRHPEIRDVCDLGQMLFWGKEWAWWGTAVMFILNNCFIQGLHVLIGAEYINTMTESDSIGHCRTVTFSVAITIICWLCSLPRTFNMMSKLGTASALFTFISVLLAAAFAGVQNRPAGHDPTLGEPLVTALPVRGVSFVNSLSAFLNISYTFIGQITLPSFIAEMRDPRDFPKSLWACTIAEIVVFSAVGGVIYAYTGNQYVTAPAFGSLETVYKKASFSLMIPTIIFLGCLYASVTARFVFFRAFQHTEHLYSHTVVGWSSWALILLVTWIIAFIISQVIPFFASLLSVMSALFDSWFGFIFWGVAFFRMRSADLKVGQRNSPVVDWMGILVNILLIFIGFFFLSVGTYASVQGIIDAYDAGTVRGVFSCASNGI
ncbi:hypothetical protein FDECE_1221 [Fusarium decemcellulare]|nr:hypothetical protein FDECE_1221 [Fusarium decemcellulare]